MAYLTLDEFKTRTLIPSANVDRLNTARPGYIAAQLEDVSAWLDVRLRKRYAAPFTAPYPPVIILWLNQIVTLKALLALGFDPESKQDQLVEVQHNRALDEVKEAADAVEGLFDLPLRVDSTATGISKGGPLGYSEASPYTWTDRQREAAAYE